ncbi:hypothetical protein QDR25_12680 [Acinetobacter baumannii]|uniref:hypothetical protein n=1 Tax=Acinetobacter baumannii TaxID=470 RepID=UPI00044D1F05|nr:hypothetical protein [Acinetobacter baumannii]EXB99041.1 hypothetical protein J539_2664 [Acinetobacter baumannii 342950]MCU7398281.1 hypothetical protein [Acinetobacter baumannii]MDC4950424.1 hypothetical protein [Acinetobacter baumannii]MDC5134169.1 hypothetical protein [Acinetobacter baumannii]MDH2481909.1 hypothetical protein [Acinetobacter baumannii]
MLIFKNNKCHEPKVNSAIHDVIKNAVLTVLGNYEKKTSPLENPNQHADRDRRAA